MIQQPPVPPPPPPFDPNLLFLNEGPAVVMIVLATLAAATIVLWPIMRALGRRLEAKGRGEPALQAEVDQLHQRLADVDALQHRVSELEERLDFAERLLTSGQETPRVPARGERP